jgi:hypothetical protein
MAMPDKLKAPVVKKGDPNKQYDVSISVIHDDRQGKSAPVRPTVRRSFETQDEAVAFANQFNTEEK